MWSVGGEGVVLDDVDGAASVVLDDLVGGFVGASADDPAVIAGLVVFLRMSGGFDTTGDQGSGVTYDGDGVLADILEPDKLEGAGPVAVHTLGLILSNDDVSQRGAGLEVEDGVLPVCRGSSQSATPVWSWELYVPPSDCSLQAPDPRSYLAQPPSNTSPAATVMTELLEMWFVGVGTPPS